MAKNQEFSVANVVEVLNAARKIVRKELKKAQKELKEAKKALEASRRMAGKGENVAHNSPATASSTIMTSNHFAEGAAVDCLMHQVKGVPNLVKIDSISVYPTKYDTASGKAVCFSATALVTVEVHEWDIIDENCPIVLQNASKMGKRLYTDKQ